jgi:hypothetical protein
MTGSVSYGTVPSAPPTDRELDAYREQADRFLAEYDEETYLHFAGLKDSYDVAAIYERHINLSELEQAQAIGLAVNGGSRIRELWQFACELYFGNLTREATGRTAELEATLSATVDGEEIPFRMLRPATANTEDRDKRQRLEEARNALTDEHLNPLELETLRVYHREARTVGGSSYTELYRKFGYGLDELAEQARMFLADTEAIYEREGDKLFRGSSAASCGTSCSPRTGCCRRSKQRSTISGSTCKGRATSSSISRIVRTRVRARSASRSRCRNASCS